MCLIDFMSERLVLDEIPHALVRKKRLVGLLNIAYRIRAIGFASI